MPGQGFQPGNQEILTRGQQVQELLTCSRKLTIYDQRTAVITTIEIPTENFIVISGAAGVESLYKSR